MANFVFITHICEPIIDPNKQVINMDNSSITLFRASGRVRKKVGNSVKNFAKTVNVVFFFGTSEGTNLKINLTTTVKVK